MNDESIKLAMAGAALGLLVFSASLLAQSLPRRESEAPTELTVPEGLLAPTGPPAATEAVEAMAWPGDLFESELIGPFAAALRVEAEAPEDRLFLCDAAGNPLEAVFPDKAGDAALGPLIPGDYSLWRSGQRLGAFRLLKNAALEDAQGQLWTDGELLHLEAFVPGTLELHLELDKPGYYSLSLYRGQSSVRTLELFVASSTPPDLGRRWLRKLEVPGLPPGPYTLVYRERPLGEAAVKAGQETSLEAAIPGS